MSEFVSTMSHEIRTPLTAILTVNEMMHNGLVGPVTDEQEEGFKIIKSSGSHLLDVINEVLDLAKIEAGYTELKISKVDINELCDSSLRLVMKQAKQKNIALTSKIPSSLPLIQVDEKCVRQILVNLLDNAVKFTEASGSVSLEIHYFDTHVRFNVIDNGIGIDKSKFESIFEPFVQISTTSNESSNGTGLGLAIVKQYAQWHGGKTGVCSEVGEGSCFYVDLINPQ